MATENNTMGPALAKKVLAVMQAITGIEKEGYNEHFRYKFAAEADVLRTVRTAMVEAGLVCMPSILAVDQAGSRTKLMMQYTLIDTDSGESYSASWSGESEDKQDKGISKAITSAGKYFLLKLFLIPTGDDPDADAPAATKKDAPKKDSAPSSTPLPPEKPPADPKMKEAGEFLTKTVGMDQMKFGDFKSAYPDGKWVDAALSAKAGKATTIEGVYTFLGQAPAEKVPA